MTTLDLTPAELNILFTRGAPLEGTLDFTDGTDPIDFSGSTFAAQVREYPDAPDIVAIDWDIDDSDSATGVLVISLTAEQTAALPPTSYWDLQMADGSTLLRGVLSPEPDVTR